MLLRSYFCQAWTADTETTCVLLLRIIPILVFHSQLSSCDIIAIGWMMPNSPYFQTANKFPDLFEVL